MSSNLVLTLAASLVLCGAGCGNSDPTLPFDAVVEDAPAALTDGPNDELCTVQIGMASESYETSRVQARIAGLVGGSSRNVIVELTELIDDDRIGQGDFLTLHEGDVPLWGPGEAGQEYEVSLIADPVSAAPVRLFHGGPWVAE